MGQGEGMGTHSGEYRLGFRGDIEGLRAIAILLVIGAHAGVPWLKGGFVGVDIFFVLSGFLITGLLVQEILNTGRLRFADFYIRRLRRLLPTLVVVLVTVGFLASLLLAPIEQTSQASAATAAIGWWSNIHFALGNLDYFSAGTNTNIFLHTWSLSVEEQFYLVWPALVYLLLSHSLLRVGVVRLRVGLIFVMLASFALCVFATYRAPMLAFYMMPMRAWQFSLGGLIWLYFKEPQNVLIVTKGARIPHRLLTATAWLGLIALFGAVLFLGHEQPYPGFYALIPTLGAACVIAAGCRGTTTGASRLLSHRLLQSIGRISYAWYLWHWPILLLGCALISSNVPVYRAAYVCVSLVLAASSYYCIEAPIRHQRWWLTHQRMTIYGALMVMVLCSFAFSGWDAMAYRASYSPAQLKFIKSKLDAPIIYGMNCDTWYHSEILTPCIFGPNNATHTAVLVGDSIAGQWFPAAAELFVRPNWRLVVLTKSACPMVDHPLFYPRIGREYVECATWRASALREIAELKPDVVLMSSVSTYSFTKAQWMDGSARVMKQISSAASYVFVIGATPVLPFDGPDCLAQSAARPPWLRFQSGCSVTLRDIPSNQVNGWLQVASEHFSNVKMVNVDDLVCPGGVCSAERNGAIFSGLAAPDGIICCVISAGS